MVKIRPIKKIIYILLMFYVSSVATALENLATALPVTQGESSILPPLRRLGIDIVDSNIDNFRKFMRRQDYSLRGYPALPFNESEIRRKISEILSDEIKNTGRFWELSLSDFVKVLPLSSKTEDGLLIPKNVELLQRKLELDYNLDAWIKPSVYFSPDQTLVRIVLVSSGVKTQILAREDILLPAQVGEIKIKSAFAQALTRLMNTIGHDGKVTYTRENLLTVDFGIERGVGRGDTLIAGYVILTSYHPQSGEYLRSERYPIHELKVLESREGSSLCQIVASDRVAFEQALKFLNKTETQFLVWRKDEKTSLYGWKEPYTPNTSPIVGATEDGFAVPLSTYSKNENNNNSIRSMLPDIIVNKEKDRKKIISQNDESSIKDLEKDEETSKLKDKQVEEVQVSYLPLKEKSILDQPDSWKMMELNLGAGITWGSANSQNTDFPSTLFNSFKASTLLDIDTSLGLKAEPYVRYSFFTGGILQGYSSSAGLIIWDPVWKDPGYGRVFYLGGAFEYINGDLTNNVTNTKINITHPTLNVNFSFEDQFPQIGFYSMRGGVSLLDFIKAQPIWFMNFSTKPVYQLPAELAFNFEYKRYPSGWVEFQLGVSWNFLPSNMRFVYK